MSAVGLVVIGAIVLVVVVAAAMLTANGRSSSGSARPSWSDDDGAGPPIGKADRPAGPGAETMDPERLGGDHEPPAAR